MKNPSEKDNFKVLDKSFFLIDEVLIFDEKTNINTYIFYVKTVFFNIIFSGNQYEISK